MGPALTAADPPVTLANWLEPPHNRWSFQHVRELVPSAEVSRGAGPVRVLPAAPIEVAPELGGLLDTTYTDAVAVLHRGRLVVEEYRNGMTPDRRHLVMSVSKSIAGTLAGALVGSGELSPGALVTDLVPELAGTSFAGATVRHLLDMRTGTREDVGTDEQAARVLEAYQWRPRADPSHELDLTAHYRSTGNDRPHGTHFEYRSILTNVLARVLERAGGRPYPQLLGERLWSRLGAEHPAEITVDGHGHAAADIGVSATLRDLARFGELLRTGGADVVPPGWIADTLTPDADSVGAFAPHGTRYLPGPGAYYRNQWWVVRPRAAGGGVYAALGIHGQLVLIDEAAEAVVVKLSSWPQAWHDEYAQATLSGCLALTARLAA